MVIVLALCGGFGILPQAVQAAEPKAVVWELMERTVGFNIRQKALRDAWIPLFLSEDDCDRQVIQLAQRLRDRRFSESRVRGWKLLSFTSDKEYGYAEAEVQLKGRSAWWMPVRARFVLTLKKVGENWLIKGPDLIDIDKES